MKYGLLLSLCLLASVAHAGTPELCQEKDLDSRDASFYQRWTAYRHQFDFTALTSAPSTTLPVVSNTLLLRFSQDTIGQVCLYTLGNDVCGANPPSGNTDSAWMTIPTSLRVTPIANSKPTVIKVSSSTPAYPQRMYGCQEGH